MRTMIAMCLLMSIVGCSQSRDAIPEDGTGPPTESRDAAVAASPKAAEPLTREQLRAIQSKADRERFELLEKNLRADRSGSDDVPAAQGLRAAIEREFGSAISGLESTCHATLCSAQFDIVGADFEQEKKVANAMVERQLQWAAGMSSVEYIRRGTQDNKGRLYMKRKAHP